MTREEAMERATKCRDEIVAVLDKYEATIVFEHGSDYHHDHFGVAIRNVHDIPNSEFDDRYCTEIDWSM